MDYESDSSYRGSEVGNDSRHEVGRLAQDLLQGNLRDATLVLNDLIRHPKQVSFDIQQANQLADNQARYYGYKSPAHAAIWQDGNVAIVDQYGRSVVQVGNIYAQNSYAPVLTNGISNYAPERYSSLPQRSNSIGVGNYASELYSAPSQPNTHSWRASYGVSGSIASTLQNRNEQVRNDMQNVTPEGRWRPNSNNIRGWKDKFDDPAMNQQLYALRQNGFANVFERPKV